MLTKIKVYLSKIRWPGLLLQLALIVFVFIAISFWQTRFAAKGEAPAFNGKLLNGQEISLSNYYGKPLLIHFWATWCPACKFSHSLISTLSEESANSNYQVLTIAIWSGSEKEVSQYMDKENLHFPVLVDQDGSLTKLYGVRGVPSNFIIDSTGNIRFVQQGYTSERGIRMRLWWLQND